MLLDLSEERALRLIGRSEVLLEEDLVPARYPTAPNSPYRRGYDWLYHVERKLIRLLRPWLADHRMALFGEHGLISEGLSNAFCHGHGRNPQSPIHLMIRLGEAGILVRIHDTGQGFHVRRTLKRFHDGKAYFSVAGNGIQRMAESQDFGVFFNASGNVFSLMYLFADGLAKQPAAILPVMEFSAPEKPYPRPTAPVSRRRPTDLKPWVRGAALRTAKGDVHRVDLGRELAEALLQVGTHLLRLSRELTQGHLNAGLPEMIHIQTPRSGLLFSRVSGIEIAAWLNQDTNPTMAGKLLRDLVASLSDESAVE